jgi:hypothetical protein
MKFHRAYFFLSSLAGFVVCCALALALGGYFRAVERSGGGVSSEKRLLAQLKNFHDQLRRAESPDEVRAALKNSEAVTGFGAESELSVELKKTYAPVLAAFAGKPRESEPRYQLSKKRELMEDLVNAYRKEVLHGDIRIRAGYLNVLFDTQTSLLSETDEAEQVYLRRNRERLDALKSLAAAVHDPGLPARVAAVDAVFQSYERGFQQAVKWRAEKTEALAKAEKALPGIAKGVFSGEDTGVDETRRTFLYVCFASLLVVSLSFLSLWLGFKVLRVRAEMKLDHFLTYLRSFGSERADSQVKNAVQTLREDGDWAPVLAEAVRAEESFLRSCHNQLAVPRSIRTPFLVVGKDRSVRYRNEEAAVLFGLKEGQEWGVQDIVNTNHLGVREGQIDTVLELIRSSLAAPSEDRFDLQVRTSESWQPYELTKSPITSGPLAGGCVLVWREVKGEADKIDRAVNVQIERVRELVHKVANRYETDFSVRETDAPATRTMLGELASLKGQVDERELLWKTEAQALIDQITRQHEILHRLADELGGIRKEQLEALELVRATHDGEEHLHDEVCVMERDLERWTTSRRRLLRDLEQQSATLARARHFEEQLRVANEGVSRELETFESELNELRRFAETAKVHSVNLSLVKDPGYYEYAARARAFAAELAGFVVKAEQMGTNVRHFVKTHPGGALAAHLNGAGLDGELLESIAEEQERLGTMVKRWRESGTAILTGGQRAVDILQEAEKKGAVLTQLGETSLLINQQAKGNLERWN